MLQIVWTYRVLRDKLAPFEAYYGEAGDWAQFFRRGAGYQGTTLLRDRDDPQRFATIDRWATSDDYQRFKNEHASEYAERDAHCAAFTEEEQLVGYFESRD